MLMDGRVLLVCNFNKKAHGNLALFFIFALDGLQ